jgi:hypothetical protein
MSKMAGLADRIARTKKNDDDQADKLSRAASICSYLKSRSPVRALKQPKYWFDSL